jgi:hypothetical protein
LSIDSDIEFTDKWTSLTYEEIQKLPIDKFDELAKMQVKLFPHLLLFGDEQDILNNFYEYYKRKQAL